VKYRFIKAHPEYPDTKWARFLEVSRSAYSEWKKTHERREKDARAYTKMICRVFEESGGRYGVDRVCAELRKRGFTASFRKVRRSMNTHGLKSIHMKRKQRSLTNSTRSRGEGFPNLIQNLEGIEPFYALSSDISYVKTGEGFEYLCQVKDVVSGVVLAHRTAKHMKAELVADTIAQLTKSWELPVGCIFHSDRGSQYTSDLVRELLKHHGICQSFSRVGKPGDNAWSESFFANLKKEAVHWEKFETREDARLAMFSYIEGFYNTKRIQRRLGYLSPIDWLNNRFAKKPGISGAIENKCLTFCPEKC